MVRALTGPPPLPCRLVASQRQPGQAAVSWLTGLPPLLCRPVAIQQQQGQAERLRLPVMGCLPGVRCAWVSVDLCRVMAGLSPQAPVEAAVAAVLQLVQRQVLLRRGCVWYPAPHGLTMPAAAQHPAAFGLQPRVGMEPAAAPVALLPLR